MMCSGFIPTKEKCENCRWYDHGDFRENVCCGVTAAQINYWIIRGVYTKQEIPEEYQNMKV